MDTCKNCNEPISGNFCSNCGQPATLRRIDGRYIIHEIKEILCGNRGFVYTIKKMLTTPGESVRSFLAKDRYRFVKPITFVIITSLIYALINHFFRISVEDLGLSGEEVSPTTILIFHWMTFEYPGYATMLTGLYMAFWIKLFFRKSGYNLFEVFILMCFISGVSALFMSVVTPFQGLSQLNIIQLSSVVLIIYFMWAVGQFFGEKKIKNYVKALIAYILGVLVLSILIVFVGTLIDVLKGVV